MRAKMAVLGVALAGLGLGVIPAQSAGATGADNVEFRVSGTLPTFPCEAGCQATFGGTGTGAGSVMFNLNGVDYNASYTILAGDVTGSADYSEPGFPFCPLVGSAASPTTGSVTLSGGATGTVYGISPVISGGSVYGASTTLSFSYVRVGATPVIQITGGSTTIDFFIPGVGTKSVTKSLVAGAGTGAFELDPAAAAARCQNPGPLAFDITGDAAVATG
jgi:hypothetical protein